MQLFPMIFFWKLFFSLKFLQCEGNSTLNIVLLRSAHPNSPLTDQDVYDLRDSLRKSNQVFDHIDDEEEQEEEDYSLNDQIEQSHPLITSSELATSSTVMFKSSSTQLQFQYLYLILLVAIQTVK